MKLLMKRLSQMAYKTSVMLTLSTFYANYHRKQHKLQNVTNISFRKALMNRNNSQTTIDEISRRMEGCIVHIDNELYTVCTGYLEVSEGTGFTVPYGDTTHSSDHIVTNYHVSYESDNLCVYLFDRDRRTGDLEIDMNHEYNARVVYVEPRYDLALIRITGGRKLNRSQVTISTDDAVKCGQSVVSIGCPDIEYSLCEGVIADGVRENAPISDGCYEYFGNVLDLKSRHIYHTCPLTVGFSGGPLLATDTGHVVGVNWGGFNTNAINFATPSSVVLDFLRDAMIFEKIESEMRYTYEMGLSLGLVVHQFDKTMKIRIQLMPGMRGFRDFPVGGLIVWQTMCCQMQQFLRFDVIVEANGQPINCVNDLQNVIKNYKQLEEEVMDIRVVRLLNEKPTPLPVKPQSIIVHKI